MPDRDKIIGVRDEIPPLPYWRMNLPHASTDCPDGPIRADKAGLPVDGTRRFPPWPTALAVWWGLVASVLAGADPKQQVPTHGHQRAVHQVIESSRSRSGFLRANAIEAAHALPRRVVPLVQLGLKDRHPAVRFAAAVTIGKLRLQEMVPAVQPLMTDPSESVRAAALWALYLCDRSVDITPLAVMLTSSDPTTRSNVAMLLGQSNDVTAAALLKDLASSPMPRASAVQEAIVRIQIAEAIVQLGDESALNALRAGAYSQFDEVRVLAVSMLGRFNDRRMAKAFAHMLLAPPIELQIAAAESLAHLGRFDGQPVVIDACRSDIHTARAQAAMALARFDSEQATQMLWQLLDDHQEQVRLSAAAAILQTVSGRSVQ